MKHRQLQRERTRLIHDGHLTLRIQRKRRDNGHVQKAGDQETQSQRRRHCGGTRLVTIDRFCISRAFKRSTTATK